MKKFLLYVLKWEMGTPVIAITLKLLSIDNIWIKTIIANIIGAIIFFPIDNMIFEMKGDK